MVPTELQVGEKMIPGPTIVKKYSECSELVNEHTITSGNTFGATFWTDGKREAPMLPDQPWLVKCMHCQSLVWIDELDEVEEDGKGLTPTEPSLAEYLEFLQQNILETEKERYVRLRAWWAGNDARRESDEKNPLSEDERQNLQVFVEIMGGPDSSDRIMEAEIMRELGEYDRALAILVEPFEDGLTQAVGIIRNLVEKKDPFVARMQFD
jgi:hypothetical protein